MVVPIVRKADIALIALLIVFAGSFYFIFSAPGGAGRSATVSINGEVFDEIPLSRDAELEVRDSDGVLLNKLIIINGVAEMTYANCPDGLCVKHRAISMSGEMIVCLPNRVVVKVTGTKGAFDAVVN